MKQEATSVTSIKSAVHGALFFATHWGAVAIFTPFINIYFDKVGLSGLQIGILSALWPVATLLVAPFVSAIADRFRWRVPILQMASLLMALTFLPLAFVDNTSFMFFLGVMLLQALARSPIVPLSETLITRMAMRRKLNYGNLRLWGSLAFASVAILGGWLWESWSYSLMFLSTAVVLLPSVWLAGRLEEGQLITRYERKSFTSLLSIPGMIPILLVTFLAGIPLGFTFNFDGIYMASLGGSDIYIGMVFGLAAFSELPTMQFSQAVIRVLNTANTVLLSLVILLVAMIGYAVSSNPDTLLTFAIVRGLGFGFFLISTVQLVDELAPEEWSSTAQSLRNAGTFGLSALLAAPLAGWLLDYFGGTMIYVVGALFMGTALIVMLVTIQRQTFREPANSEQTIITPAWSENQGCSRQTRR